MANKVIVEGEAVIRDGKGNSIEMFEESFIVANTTEAEARCIIRRGFIDERLREKLPNFKRTYLMRVKSFEPVKEESANKDLDRLFLEASELGCLPRNIANYKRKDYKAKALKTAIEKHHKRVEAVEEKAQQNQGM